MTTIKSLKGKTINNIKYNNVYREKIVVDFTDGTTAFFLFIYYRDAQRFLGRTDHDYY